VTAAGPARAEGSGSKRSAAILALGALLFAATAGRSLDDPIDWREDDLSAIARSFHREGMHPLYPRIDWRGDGPGYTEMEPPLLSLAMAALYPILGEEPRVGRWISWAASVAALAVFLALARDRLSTLGAGVAGLFYAIHPLAVRVAPEIRPEPLMLLGCVAAVLFFTRWLRSGSRRDQWLALGATAFAVFAKLPALHLGLLFAALVLRQRGRSALRDPKLWGFAAVAVLPAAVWHLHAHGLWREYGNSLGLSNQDHFFGLDLLTHPKPLLDALAMQQAWVLSVSGALGVAVALALGGFRRWLELEVWWVAAIALYLGLAAPLTGQGWAYYYHVVAVPPAALLVGGAAETFAAVLRAPGRSRRRRLGVVGACLLAAALLQTGARTLGVLRERGALGEVAPDPLLSCAREFAQHVAPGTPILVSGGACRDPWGRRKSHHRPYFFYWLDCRGWQPCREEHSLELVEAVAARGAQWFIAERRDLHRLPGYETELRARFPVAAECEAAVLFRLRPDPQAGT
jgi:hypothetical protein